MEHDGILDGLRDSIDAQLMLVMIFVAAVASVGLSVIVGQDSLAFNLVNTAWILAPYLVLTAVMIVEKRTSLMATAIATLCGSVGALAPAVIMTVVEGSNAARFVPIYQAGGIAVLVPTCRWITARIDGKL